MIVAEPFPTAVTNPDDDTEATCASDDNPVPLLFARSLAKRLPTSSPPIVSPVMTSRSIGARAAPRPLITLATVSWPR